MITDRNFNKELVALSLEIINKEAHYQLFLLENSRNGYGAIRINNLIISINFKNNFLDFYTDTCGQRGHYIVPFMVSEKEVVNKYIIKRNLSFMDKEDEGKQDAILAILDLNNSKLIAINRNVYEFEFFNLTIHHHA